MVSVVTVLDFIEIISGLYNNFSDNFCILFGIVAEKNKVCLSFGINLINFSISGKNHISSILSASSNIKYSILSNVNIFCSNKSINLPGVATNISTHFLIAFS